MTESQLSSKPRLVIDNRSDRVVVSLNRPEVRNAIDEATTDALDELCRELERRPRIALFVGAGGDFAAGADIGELATRSFDDALRGINASVFQRVRRLPMPTIALVDGYAFGGGAELAMSCDFRIGTPRTRFANPEARLGIAAAAGATWRLKEIVGETLALQVLLAGRVLKAEEALSSGLLGKIVAPESLERAGHDLADSILTNAPAAVRLTKLLVQAPPEAHPSLDHLAQTILLQTDDASSRLNGFLRRTASKETP